MYKKNFGKIILSAALIASLGACSSGPQVQEFANSASPTEELQRLSTDVQAAKNQQTDVLAPSDFQDAEKSLKKAIDAQSDGKAAKDVLHRVATARAYLNRAAQTANISHTNMEDVVQARQAAINAGAPRYFKTDFNDVDKNLAEVISSVEANKLDSLTKNRAKLQAAYLEVELKAIKETNLGPARATLGLATKEGAQDHAPQSLASTEKKIADADAFIVANRHDTAGIQAISKIALDSANHLVRINREAKEGKNITAEESALRVEREQAKTAEEANRLKTANSQLDAAAQAAAATATANARLEAEAAALKSEQAFNQKLEAARAEFTESEAEVYRQGNRLVIRLHSLEFPRNKAVLRSTNMPIMAKVEKVVKEFNNPTVIVEGHTDSDGGKALNQKLSTQRSELISSYLVSSKAVDTSHISSKGYGYDRPIASNKTPEGKAQNRRVDVIITPTTEPAIQAR